MKHKRTITDILFSFQKDKKGFEQQIFVYSCGLLFIVSVVYFYGFAGGLFFSQLNEKLFLYTREYFFTYLSKPGGVLEYLANFLMQGYFNNILGTLIISSFPLLFAVLLLKIQRRLNGNNSFLLLTTIITLCLLLLLQTDSDYFLYQSLGFLFVLIGFYFSLVVVSKFRYFLFVILLPVLYYLTGAFAFVYLGLCLVYCFVYEKGIFRFFIPVLLILIAFLTFYVFKEVIFIQPVSELLKYPIISKDFDKLSNLFYLLSTYLILVPLIAKFSVKIKFNLKQRLFDFIILSFTFVATIIFLFVKYDREETYLMRFEKLIFEQNWPEIIRYHEESPLKSMEGQFFYNLALSEEGQLCNRLFFGHQDFGKESLFLPRSRKFVAPKALFYCNIGLTAEALHLAYESLVINGYQPQNLKLIIKLELIHGNYKVAERYIKLLKNTLLYRDWAKEYEKLLFEPLLIKADKELGEKIKLVTNDDFFISSDDARNIDLALIINPLNKKAFEYKMAGLLLDKDFKSVVYQVKKMKNMGYKTIPRHIEEAVVFFMHQNYELPYLGRLDVDPETLVHFRKFETENNTNNDAAIKDINTFWFYMKNK